jgi:hypothetical protein
MPPLRDLQERIGSRRFATGSEPLCDLIRSDGISASARLEVYRNNLHAGFTKTLGLEFPVIRRLVGEEYFRQVARAFLACYPSRSGDLHHVGGPFARFLRTQFVETEYLYLADVARLEWAYQECLVAEGSDCLRSRTRCSRHLAGRATCLTLPSARRPHDDSSGRDALTQESATRPLTDPLIQDHRRR